MMTILKDKKPEGGFETDGVHGMLEKESELHRVKCEQAKRDFGSLVQRAREGLGWSQAELAMRIGSSASVISRVERATRPPTGDQVFLLCSVLSLSVFDIGQSKPPRNEAPAAEAIEISRDDLIGLIRLKIDNSYREAPEVLNLIDLDAADNASLQRLFQQLWGKEFLRYKRADEQGAPRNDCLAQKPGQGNRIAGDHSAGQQIPDSNGLNCEP